VRAKRAAEIQLERARSAAILAGGAGIRMGAPKPGVDLDGRPLISYAVDAARAAGLEPLVVAKSSPDLPDVGCGVLIEPDETIHPLAGIVAALSHAGAPIVVLPCDAPLVPPELLVALASRAAPFAMPTHPRAQPLVARYAPALLPRLRVALAAEEPMVSLANDLGGDRLGAAELTAFGDPDWMFANANDPAELERLATELRRRRRPSQGPLEG